MDPQMQRLLEECKADPIELYTHDPVFNKLVDLLKSMMKDQTIRPLLLQKACSLAIKLYIDSPECKEHMREALQEGEPPYDHQC